MNVAQIEARLAGTKEQIEALRAEAFALEGELRRQRDVEEDRAARTHHERIRTVHTDTGAAFEAVATWPRSTPAGPKVWEIGVGVEGKLLAVYAVTSYRGDFGAIKYGAAPDTVDIAVRRAFDLRRPGT
jgi:hypothetical protein